MAPGGAGSDENAGAAAGAVGAGLRWRGFPYAVRSPKFAKAIYGGAYVAATFKRLGVTGPVDGEDWDLLWTHRGQGPSLAQLPLLDRAPGRQRLVNHCGHLGAAGDKCTMARHTAWLKELPNASSRHLLTYDLTDEEQRAAWRRDATARPLKPWILKPCFGGDSSGIEVARGRGALEAQARLKGPTVAQEFLEHPYLGVGGRKFHLRLYVLAVRWEPPAVYLFDDGLLFRSRRAYTGEPSVDRDVFSSISAGVEGLPLRALWRRLDALSEASVTSARRRGGGGSATAGRQLAPAPGAGLVRGRIVELLRELLGRGQPGAARRPPERGAGRYACFDLFGADVILDRRLEPHVMEINTGPNLWVSDKGEANAEQLLAVKGPLVEQVLRWAAARVRSPPGTGLAALEAAEAAALVNFTRLL